jgi:hypothetical protein
MFVLLFGLPQLIAGPHSISFSDSAICFKTRRDHLNTSKLKNAALAVMENI